MKRISFLATLLALVLGMNAQVNMYVWQDGIKTIYAIQDVDSITFEEIAEQDPSASLISVEDNSISDWGAIPNAYLATASTVSGASCTALKSVKVYADKRYINVLVEHDPTQITGTAPFHIYLNADYSASTGGFGNQWSDADTEVMLEASLFADGEHVSYNPLAFRWTGAVGSNGWSWEDMQGGMIIGKSQMVGNKVEIQLHRDSIPANWNNTQFSIGFDIQQNWNSVGILPNANSGLAKKLVVKIHQESSSTEPEIPSSVKEVSYVESSALFPNPERGFLKQIYYTSEQLGNVQSSNTVKRNREQENVTLYLDNYFMMDYIESDISPTFLNRMENNFKALRAGGGKAVIRYSYQYSQDEKPWDATAEWILRHIEQLQPYWEEYADVILCLEAGFIGVWGEWYYTENFPFNPSKDADYEPRWVIVNKLLEALPADRQIALRTPAFKKRYLKKYYGESTALTAEEAYKNTAKARLCGHNDCFVASKDDYGTYASDDDRAFWAEDTKYTLMGGETCGECGLSTGANAIKEMTKYHWTYINDGYHPDVLDSWEKDGSMTEIKRRLGYRFVLETGRYEVQEGDYVAALTLRNDGFAALANPRDVELVFVSKTDATDKYVYKQEVDPRFWMAGEKTMVTLRADLDEKMQGAYSVYLNLPDPYETLHDNPAFSIRLANEDMWEEATGYNYLTDIEL